MPTVSTQRKRSLTVRKPGGAKPKRRARPGRRTTPAPRLPGWKELSARNEQRPTERKASVLETISTGRFALLLIAVAAGFTLYVGHVHATQDLLAEVQTLRRDNLRLHLKHNRLKGAFDEMTGPAVIYRRARVLGLEESVAYGPTIHLK